MFCCRSSKDEEQPAEEDDSDIPFKKRRLPSFISLRSEESSETKEKAELAGRSLGGLCSTRKLSVPV